MSADRLDALPNRSDRLAALFADGEAPARLEGPMRGRLLPPVVPRVVVDLDLDGFEGSSEGCNDAADADALQAIIDNPGGYYVNVHNEAYPGGAIRGQLAAESPNTALANPAGPLAPLTVMGALAIIAAMAIGARTFGATRVRP